MIECPIDFNPKKIMNEFVFSDHFLIGQRHAKTVLQLQKALGDKEPEEESYAGHYRRHRTQTTIGAARRRFQSMTPPRFLYSKKLKNKPTIYYLVNPDSEEFVDLFERNYTTFLRKGKKLRNWQLLIHETLPKVKDAKIKKALSGVYNRKISE